MTAPLRLCLATHNLHKVEELQHLLAVHAPELIPRLQVLSLADLGIHDEVVEDGVTFLENARKKAQAAHERTGLWALADDSGLEVAALSGAPGIYSARYGGPPGPGQSKDARNREVLLTALRDVPKDRRQARFFCVLCLYGQEDAAAGPAVIARSGECSGHLLFHEQGDGGFGYDSLFVPEAGQLAAAGLAEDRRGLTFAELAADEKNRLSHRARALAALREALAALVTRPRDSSSLFPA